MPTEGNMPNLILENSEEQKRQWIFKKELDFCPVCRLNIKPIYCFGYYSIVESYPEEYTDLQLIYRCPNNSCQSLFIAYYTSKNVAGREIVDFIKVAPYNQSPKEFSKEISTLSPSFCDLYNQSKAGEEYGLIGIAGAGYRKAFEFLIKDFCIQQHPNDKDAINKLPLQEVIKNHIDNEKIKELSKRAAWLGNDEVHYERIWTNNDINDLKKILDISQYWISSEIQAQDYIVGIS
jgi:hypothetical protein